MAKSKPRTLKIAGGEVFHATVLKVLTRDADGAPRTFEIMHPDESTKVTDGQEFWIVYASEKVLRPAQQLAADDER